MGPERLVLEKDFDQRVFHLRNEPVRRVVADLERQAIPSSVALAYRTRIHTAFQ